MQPPVLFQLDRQTIGWHGGTVLDDLSLSIRRGEKVAIVGKSGSGKTTLLRALYRQSPQSIAFCEQAPGLVPTLSAFHNIYMGQLDQHPVAYNLLNLFYPLKKEIAKVAPLASVLGLSDKLSTAAERLSGGQQQRVALGRTIFQNKSVFIGDEPVSAVDEVQAEDLLAYVVKNHETVVLALHHIEQALKYCHRIIGIKDGKVALDAATEGLTPDTLRQLYEGESQPSQLKDNYVTNADFKALC